jgi:hypothetical protein
VDFNHDDVWAKIELSNTNQVYQYNDDRSTKLFLFMNVRDWPSSLGHLAGPENRHDDAVSTF